MQDERVQKPGLVRRNPGPRALESRKPGSGGDRQDRPNCRAFRGGRPSRSARAFGRRAVQPTQGRTRVVENRPGASTVIGTEAVARATPDGNTILMQGPPLVINAILRPSVTYDPLTSFEPICLLVNAPMVLVVNSSSAFRSLADFLAAARARPGELTFASFGPGTPNHCRRGLKARCESQLDLRALSGWGCTSGPCTPWRTHHGPFGQLFWRYGAGEVGHAASACGDRASENRPVARCAHCRGIRLCRICRVGVQRF